MLTGVTNRPDIARTALALGVVGSLSFNVAWAWPSSVLTGVGVLMAFTLPTAVSLWRASGQVTGWARIERAAVMSFIAVGAATYTAVHAALLLRDAGLPMAIAWLPALVGEALVVMAARASSPSPKPSPVRTPKREPKREPKQAAQRDVTPQVAPVAPVGESPQEKQRRQARDRQARRRDKQRQEAFA
jgi:hypothetical protein